ncbi:MAG: DUF3108 domain-containing protein [Deltaproteobacteria bacterium]|nr:DUF3108 domain-containing protein [Deltaproteobacteria bacterium]
MDFVPGAIMSGRSSRSAALRRKGFFLPVAFLAVAMAGCHWGQPPSKPAYVPPPSIEEPAGEAPAGEIVAEIAPESSAGPDEPPQADAPRHPVVEPSPSSAAEPATSAEMELAPPAAHGADVPPAAGDVPAPAVRKTARPVTPATAPSTPTRPNSLASLDEPSWAKGREELVYRVEFLGMTMGYARFNFRGKTMLGSRETYHLSVRAWTSDFLSVIYPINETIEYYMDVKTLEPLRQESTGRAKKKDDIMFYDQKKGRIVYRYKHSGEIRKEVDVVPGVFDPVTVAYYFRARDLGDEGRSRNVYGGRKLYQIASRLLGREKIDTVRGKMDTVVIQPVIKREGKLEDKGDLKMWMTDDARRIPVRIYAKFRKIRMWTLFAELVPPREGG